MSSPGYSSVQKLSAGHEVSSFDCGNTALDRYLQKYALPSQGAGSARTYVVCSAESRRVVGYYSLAVGSVEHEEAPERVTRGLARHPVPIMLLARLAIDLGEQRAGLGSALLKDALLRTLQAADIAGIRAVLVHVKDEQARRWCQRFDFEPSPTDPLHLFLLIKDLRHLALER